MRFVHDIEGDSQSCGSLHGDWLSLTIVVPDGPEQIDIEGPVKYVRALLQDALNCVDSLTEKSAQAETQAR